MFQYSSFVRKLFEVLAKTLKISDSTTPYVLSLSRNVRGIVVGSRGVCRAADEFVG